MNALAGIILAPLVLGVINRTKAIFAGRTGPPLVQPYVDLWKLLGKGVVYSPTTTWVFRAGPVVGLAAVAATLTLLPFGGARALIAFPGDVVVVAYLLGLMRFVTVLAALDTGSSFEGMGASREVAFSAVAEPALLLGIAVVAFATGNGSLSGMFAGLSSAAWAAAPAPLLLACTSVFVVFLAENARIPVDDPNTHLELTMIHEVMVLDHSGPDLGFIKYGAALKVWVLGSLLVGIAVPAHGYNSWINFALALVGMIALAVVAGAVESSMARLRFLSVPRLLLGALGCSLIALLLVVWT